MLNMVFSMILYIREQEYTHDVRAADSGGRSYPHDAAVSGNKKTISRMYSFLPSGRFL